MPRERLSLPEPLRRMSPALWWATYAAAAAALQVIQSAPFDADTGDHIAVARLLREHGLLRAFRGRRGAGSPTRNSSITC